MTEVEQLLRDRDIYYRYAGKDILVKCFNPEHDDSKPSMRIDRLEGMYHCLSCGFKGNVFHDFNVYRNVFNSKVSALKEKIRNLYTKASGATMPHDAFPMFEPLRGIKAETYKKFGAFTSTSEFPDRIVFPIKDYSGNIIGYNGRHKLPSGEPKYLVKPDGADFPLWPPVTAKHTSMVLVEGLYDALNLHDKGMTNASCCFGTQRLSVNTIYEKFLPYMIRGITKVYILFDGDEAGRDAALKIKDMLILKTEMSVEILQLSAGQDPGELTQAQVDMLNKAID